MLSLLQLKNQINKIIYIDVYIIMYIIISTYRMKHTHTAKPLI